MFAKFPLNNILLIYVTCFVNVRRRYRETFEIRMQCIWTKERRFKSKPHFA